MLQNFPKKVDVSIVVSLMDDRPSGHLFAWSLFVTCSNEASKKLLLPVVDTLFPGIQIASRATEGSSAISFIDLLSEELISPLTQRLVSLASSFILILHGLLSVIHEVLYHLVREHGVLLS